MIRTVNKHAKGIATKIEHNMKKDILIETSELDKLLKTDQVKNLRVLDCSWFLPSENKNVPEMFKAERIPYSQLFEIDDIADKTSGLPHMMPTDKTFVSFMKRMDIRLSDHIICYDRSGIFSSPRVWFTFKVFGAKNVSILNGGFPKWKSEGLPLETGNDFRINNLSRDQSNNEDFDYKLDSSKLLNAEQILTQSEKQKKRMIDEHIIDCRSAPRYKGEVEEPRPTIRKGHVDEAHNVFFKDLLDSQSCYKNIEEIQKEFESKNIDLNKPLSLYCGSGTTACVNILALCLLGKFDNCKLYDGSWSEMGNITPEELENKLKLINERL